MTIATEKLKGSVARSTFVRLTPRRYINSDSYTTLAALKYQFTFDYPIASIINGSYTLTRVTTVTGDNEYSYDEDTGELIVQLISGLESPLVVSYYLFYNSSAEDVIAYETPTDSTTTARNWQARISTAPIVNTSFRNILDGVATVTSSAIQLVNTDNAFQEYLTISDSFSKAAAEIWIKYGDSFRKIYTGKISGVTLDSKSVNLAIDESTSALLDPAYMGDDLDECFIALSEFSTAYDEHIGNPIPFIIGRNRHGVDTIGQSGDPTLATQYQHVLEDGVGFTYYDVKLLNYEQCTKASCIAYSTTISGTANRDWMLCKTGSSGFKTLSLGTPTGSVITVKANTAGNNANDQRFQLWPADDTTGINELLCWVANYSSTPNGNLEVGDSFKQISTGWHYMVTYVGSNFVRGYIADAGSTNVGADTYATSDFTMNQAPAIVVHDSESGQQYYPLYDLDFTYTIESTAGGNYRMYITFVSNFETATTGGERNHPNMTTIHPKTHTVAFRATQATTGNSTRHDNVVKYLVEASGLSTDTTSFTDAGTDFTGLCQFQIPAEGEDTIGSYLSYIQRVVKSTFGYISQDTDGSVKYSLFEIPSSGDIYTEDEILQGSFGIDISYQDIITSIQANNPHIVNKTSSDVYPLTSTWSHELNSLDNKELFEHVLVDISTRLDDILRFKQYRRATYSFSTATYAIESLPGDNIRLDYDSRLSTGQTYALLKIISMSISEKQIDIVACDFLGVGWGLA